MGELNFSDYDKITDTLMFFSDSIMLEFVVDLSSGDKNKNRVFFHSEIEYDSNKYYGVDKGHSIKRRMSFHFTIRDRNAFDRSIIIRPEDAIMLTMVMERQILPWYFDQKKKIFSVIDGQLKITGKYQDVTFARNEYTYLIFQPCVYTFEDNTFKEGVRMYVSSQSVFVDMEIDKFLGLYYYISKTDMYAAACSLTSYAKIGPFGINTFSFGGLGSYGRNQLDNKDLFNDIDTINKQPTQRDVQMSNFFNRTNKKKKD